MPRVSVITPAYNAAQFLSAAIESVLGQTIADWEHIIVDDGSSDATPRIIAEYESRGGGRVIGIRQKNQGLPAARNRAIRRASAPYLALLDADDMYMPDRLAAVVEALDADPSLGLVHANTVIIDVDGRRVGHQELGPGKRSGFIVRDLYTGRTRVQCPTATIRRSCLEEVGLFDESMRATEDRDLWVRIAARYKVRHIDRPLAFYRRSPHSMSASSERMAAAQMVFIEKNRNLPGCGALARRQALSRLHREYGDRLLAAGQSGLARRKYLQGLIHDPRAIANAYMLLKSFIV